MVDDLVNDAKERMAKSVDATRTEFNTVRTGRATPALLDRLVVEYYGVPTPLQQMATVSAPDPRSLLIQPYDVNSLGDIEKAINESDMLVVPQPETAVLDPFCRTHDVDNLYVVDASFFPSSAAVNPGLTIAAQALRVADHIRDTALR